MKILNKAISIFLIITFGNVSIALAWDLKDVYRNLHINTSTPGNYQDAAAGWYSGGGAAIRTKNTSMNPIGMTAPSLKTGCNGIDAFAGSFSMISGGEIVTLAENIGSQAVVYGFHLGMKTYAPQIETLLKDLRNLSMELNQFGIGHCKVTQAAFAAALPRNTAMYETVCGEMASGSGADLGGQRKKCRDHSAQATAVARAQERDPDLLMDNYNLFIKAATNAGIPKELHGPLMSMVGTIIVRDGVMIPYPSLASNSQSWNIHINGGEGASMYSCGDASCLTVNISNNISISKEASYAGLARSKLETLKIKMYSQTEDFNAADKGLLDSLGQKFPVFDHMMLEAVSNASILDGSSEVIARSMLLSHLTSVTNDIRRGVIALKQKQINDQYLSEYEKSLNRLLIFASNQWAEVMTDADRINSRAEKIEKHLISRERG